MKIKQRFAVVAGSGACIMLLILLRLIASYRQLHIHASSHGLTTRPAQHFSDILDIVSVFVNLGRQNKTDGRFNEPLLELLDSSIGRSQTRVDSLLYLAKDVGARREADQLTSRMNHILPRQAIQHIIDTLKDVMRPLGETESEAIRGHPSQNDRKIEPWHFFQDGINHKALYREDDDQEINDILHDLQTLPIISMNEMSSFGTQIKFLFRLFGGYKAIFKPMRMPREYEASVDLHIFDDYERHHAEIAVFHLDRILGFRRVPPVAGRKIDMMESIYKLAKPSLKMTFSKSAVNNTCVYGRCSYFCDSKHTVCGEGHMLEGSMAAFIPDIFHMKKSVNPWRRSYSRGSLAEWQLYPNGYCQQVKQQTEFSSERRLLDVIDLHVLDFIADNQDRHHLVHLSASPNVSFYVAFDNGRGFGRPRFDDLDILAPLTQCCVIRASTLRRLVDLDTGGVPLSKAMRDSLRAVPLEPVLTELHLQALDRRVKIVLREVYHCLEESQERHAVVVDDGL